MAQTGGALIELHDAADRCENVTFLNEVLHIKRTYGQKPVFKAQ